MIHHPPAQPHGDIQPIAEGVHWVRGSVRVAPGLRIARNMAIVVHDGDVTLVNAVRLDEAGEAKLEALGRIKHVVKIGAFHGMDDPYYLAKHGAAYWALPKGTRSTDQTPTETLAPDHLPFADGELFAFEKSKLPEGGLLVKRAGGILLMCDAVQNWPDTAGCNLPAKIATRIIGFTRRPAVIGPPWRKAMTREGDSLKADFDRLAKLPFDRLLGAHGGMLETGAQAALAASIAATF